MNKSYLALCVAAGLLAPAVLAAEDKPATSIEVIMVKGEKIASSLQDKTSSVAVFSQQDI